VLLGFLIAPLVALSIALRPALRAGWRERLGGGVQPTPGRVWVHGASLGEAQMVTSLVARLEEAGLPCFASAVTATGRAALSERLGDTPHAYAPIDHPWCVQRCLERVAPRALVLVETELWPFLILAARARGVPVYVVSGRISERSFPRYRTFRRWVAPLLSRFAGVAARSREDAARFVELGVPEARVAVLGDLKLDPSAAEPGVAAELVRALEGQPVWVAGSTHAGEEAAVLEALAVCERRGASAVLVLAPRHLERVDSVVAEAERRGRRVMRRTRLAGARPSPGDVLVLDTSGELAALYATASIAFVGGTLVPVGGHNLLEPLFQGAPVAMGPHTDRVREAATLAVECGAGIEVADAEELGEVLFRLLFDSKDARARGEAGRRAVASRAGSLARSVRWLREGLESDGKTK